MASNHVFDVFDTVPLILLQPLPRACPPQLRFHQSPVSYISFSSPSLFHCFSLYTSIPLSHVSLSFQKSLWKVRRMTACPRPCVTAPPSPGAPVGSTCPLQGSSCRCSSYHSSSNTPSWLPSTTGWPTGPPTSSLPRWTPPGETAPLLRSGVNLVLLNQTAMCFERNGGYVLFYRPLFTVHLLYSLIEVYTVRCRYTCCIPL